MAKKRKIKNMTRAEHKRALEDAVRNQVAAIREAREQVFLPKLNRSEGKHKGDMYAQVVETGQELLGEHNIVPGSRREKIMSYYSRKDVQQALYDYARGRKLSVLRTFRPMFNGSRLRKPEDLLPIMMFYSQESGLWPSMHGTVSRLDSGSRWVCDLIIEVDYKKSRTRAFNLSRPLIRLFQDLGLDFRMKFSGNSSPHIIIPAEAFPKKWRDANKCRNLYGNLLDFLRKQIKQPKTLDGSFRNPSHFLRMPYSLNENTGLVSIPMRIEDYERFSWEMARPENVVVMEDWWSIPEDAPERTEALIEMAFSRRTVIAINSDPKSIARGVLAPEMPDVLGAPVQMGIVRSGEEIAARGNALMKDMSMQNALNELRTSAADNGHDAAEIQKLTRIVAQKHRINKGDLQLLRQWLDMAHALAHYSRTDVQEAMYSYVQGRCIALEGMDEYINLNNPSDAPALAAYMVGGGAAPAFRCTNARYNPEDGKMTDCDVVIRVAWELAGSVALLIRGFDVPSFALYSGNGALQIVIPFRILEASIDMKLSRLPSLATALERHLRWMLKGASGIHVSIYEGSTLIPYSLTEDGKQVNLPVKLEDVYKLSSDMARPTAVRAVKEVDLFIPQEERENAARFFNDVVL